MSSESTILNQPHVDVPTGGCASGDVRPPGSKSVSHRMMNLALLEGRPIHVRNLLEADDLDLFRGALDACGWQLEQDPGELRLEPPRQPVTREVVVDCGNAGTMFRFVLASLAAVPGQYIVDGTPRLRERPAAPLVRTLRSLGALIEGTNSQQPDGHAPLRVQGGSLRAGNCRLDAGESSQYLSAMLMACAHLPGTTQITVERLTSAPYVEITLDAMRTFGLAVPQREADLWTIRGRTPGEAPGGEPRIVEVDGDYSAAAYPAAAAMITGGRVRLLGLDPDSSQGDRGFLDVLVSMGGEMSWTNEALEFSGRPRKAVDVDLSAMPDQVPTLAAVAAFCPGTTRVRNVAHLRIKESDRLHAVASQWSRLGVPIRELDDGLVIEGCADALAEAEDRPEIETFDDHRIAMSAALVGLRRRCRVLDPRVVAKSYPRFWDDLFRLIRD